MSPEEFIKKHITDALVGEGFPAEIAWGGLNMVLIITGAALRPAGREACSLIVSFGLANGLSVRQRLLNGKRARKRPGERVNLNPACSDFALQYLLESIIGEKFREKQYQ